MRFVVKLLLDLVTKTGFPALTFSIKLVGARCSVFGRAHRDSTIKFLLLQHFSVAFAVKCSSCFISVLNFDLYVCCFDA